jgi:hypothetical protein
MRGLRSPAIKSWASRGPERRRQAVISERAHPVGEKTSMGAWVVRRSFTSSSGSIRQRR